MNIVDLKKDEPDAVLIETLVGLLEKARSGEIRGIAVAGVNSDSSSFNVFVSARPVTLLGEIQIMQNDLIMMHCDTRLHPAGRPF